MDHRLFSFAVLILIVSSANANPPPVYVPYPNPQPDQYSVPPPLLAPPGQTAANGAVQQVVSANNAFACDLYARLAQQNGNLFFSPYSISAALTMTFSGANGPTRQQVAQVLHCALPDDRFHAGASELAKQLTAGGPSRPYQLNLANALLGQKGFTFQPAFLKTMATRYGAGFRVVDFAHNTGESRRIINDWVAKQTQGKIGDLLGPNDVNSLTRLVLVNAVYFKSEWEHKFLQYATRPANFTLAPGAVKQVPTMAKLEYLAYFDGGSFQMASLPYKAGALSMVVLLPKQLDGMAQLEQTLIAANLNQWLSKMSYEHVDLELPKFRTTSRFELSQVLSAMGMPLAFTDAADFSGITIQEKWKIARVVHKAFVDVQEKNTEAAAATAVVSEPGAAPGFGSPPPPIPFHADHPFLFLIRDNVTGSILFMGRVMDP